MLLLAPMLDMPGLKPVERSPPTVPNDSCGHAPPDGTFQVHVECDEGLDLPVELDAGHGNVDAAESSGPSCIEAPDGTSHVDCDEDLNLADNAETSAEAIPSVNGCGLKL